MAWSWRRGNLHMSPAEAIGYGLKDGDVVALQVEGPRATVLENLVVRSGEAHSLEAHIDKDDGKRLHGERWAVMPYSVCAQGGYRSAARPGSAPRQTPRS